MTLFIPHMTPQKYVLLIYSNFRMFSHEIYLKYALSQMIYLIWLTKCKMTHIIKNLLNLTVYNFIITR